MFPLTVTKIMHVKGDTVKIARDPYINYDFSTNSCIVDKGGLVSIHKGLIHQWHKCDQHNMIIVWHSYGSN